MKKESLTKRKIKEAALFLFNEEGTLPTTTNHIAKYAKISTGNLYYHYKNKEQIIEDIYIKMSEEFDQLNSFDKLLNSENPIKELSNAYDRFGELFYKYRFMMRDSSVLIALYENIKDIFLERERLRISQIENLIEFFIQKDIFIPLSQEEIKLNAKLNWFISTYWQNFITIDSKITKETIKEMKEVVFKTNIIPLLTKKGKILFEEI
ncbi:TetR/AcrR family transcriptional regulator [Halarcobacter sp.]|uniref:TetR/AcrR family transcriptional regulator n=1 Tax=Halarcobacter sp. TaxID=2321133 RepID=UPI002AABA42A|nr:TetR/AcrR family transcriptional regulator [Halarcobacter sp.]